MSFSYHILLISLTDFSYLWENQFSETCKFINQKDACFFCDCMLVLTCVCVYVCVCVNSVNSYMEYYILSLYCCVFHSCLLPQTYAVRFNIMITTMQWLITEFHLYICVSFQWWASLHIYLLLYILQILLVTSVMSKTIDIF